MLPDFDCGGLDPVAHACGLARLEDGPSGTMLVVAAHPDDETIGLGATLAELVAAGWRVSLLHVTDGAPRDAALRPRLRDASVEEARAIRRAELAAALHAGGAGAVEQASLDVPDQDAAREMPAIARALAHRFAALRPDVVVTHGYEGGHPDHDAVAFAVGAARHIAGAPAARLLEMTSYHAAPGAFTTAAFATAPARGCLRRHDGLLAPAARARKRAMLDAFATQREVLAAFDADLEPLRCAPRRDFTRPPHPGTLHYETVPFGWTGERWRELARRACVELGVIGHERHAP